ncbi:hypothetical protein G7054_g11867 [Neopestalotiopsis clavispora]|nr:hypothetical protein G7054_g11867 [Neopestalotiopsis clavispora]
MRRVGNKFKGGSANDADSGPSGVMLNSDEIDPLQMRSDHENLGQDSTGEGAGLPLQGSTTDPTLEGRKLALPSDPDGNGHNGARHVLQPHADAMRPDILEMRSDGHLGSLSDSIDPQYLSVDERSQDRQAEIGSIQSLASQNSWPRDQLRTQDSSSAHLMRKPLVRGDPSHSVKAGSEVVHAAELHDNDKLDKSPGRFHAENHSSGLSGRYTPTGLVSSHQTAIISSNSKKRDTSFAVTNNICDSCSKLESDLIQRGNDIDDLEKAIKDVTRLLELEKTARAAREKELEDQLEQAKDFIQRKLSEKVIPSVRPTIPGVGLLPDMVPSKQGIQNESHDRGKLAALKKITPTYTVFLRTSNDCIDMVQAVIWEKLSGYIFASRNCSSWVYWSGNLNDKLKPTIDSVSRGHWEDTNFHLWRSQTAALISSYALDEEVKVQANSIVGELEKDIKYLLKGWESGLRNDLSGLVIDALKLDIDLSQQKAWWFCEYPGAPDRRTRYDIEFQSATMKAANDNFDERTATHATLMISPALMKAGNSNGGNYNMVQLAVESSVHRGKPRMVLTKSKPVTNTSTTLVRGHPTAKLARQEQRRAQNDAEEKKHGEKKMSIWKQMATIQ